MVGIKVQGEPIRREIELDFIRGLAILLVMDFHFPVSIFLVPFTWLGFKNFGGVGVDLFFVLSGFLVGGLLVKEWKLRSRIDSRRFLIRRGLKIWPQYYVFLGIMLVSGHRGLRSCWGNLLNIQNYVGGVAHTWTLAVEEHAYLLLAVVLTLAARKRLKMRHLFLGIGVTVCLVLAWSLVFAAHGGDGFARTDTRIDGILYGLMLAMLYHSRPTLFRRLQRWVWAWIGIIVLVLAYFRVTPTTWWGQPVAWASADVLGVAVLMLLYRHRDGGQRPMVYRLVAWIGLYSYGIYLWHVSVVAPSLWIAHRLPKVLGLGWMTVGPPLLAIGIGVSATKLIEFPALALRDRLFPRRVDSAVGIPAEVEQELGIRTPMESVSASDCETLS